MISYDTSARKTWVVAGSIALGLAVAAGVWWSMGRGGDAPDAVEPQASAASAMTGPHSDQLKRAAAALQGQPEILPDGRPSDFEADEWKTLKEAMAQNPNAEKELLRVADYLRYQRGLELWQNMAEQGNTPERRKLAEKLLEGLPQRLSNAEVTFAEGLMVCAALINEMEASEGLRNQRIEQCKVRLEQASPKPTSEEAERDAACLADWERRKAAITADFYNKSPAERAAGQKQFEAELEKARLEIYGSPACSDAGGS